MIKKIILRGREAREKLLKGASMAGELVGRTLGPKGRNVIIQRGYHAPRITNDGVTLLKHSVLNDETEDLGFQTVVEAAMKTDERVGDGTTTTGVMASKLIEDCAALIEKQDSGRDEALEGTSTRADVVSMSREILDARDKVLACLAEMAKPVKKGDLKKIVQTSLGKVYPQYVDMVTDIVEQTGVDGYVSVEENFGTKYGIESELHKGMRFMGSYASPVMTAEKMSGNTIYFNKKKEAIMEDCAVLVTNHRVETTVILQKIHNELRNAGKRKFCIISYGYENTYTQSAISSIISNLQGINDAIRILAIKAPALTTDQLQDICAYTGAKLINKDWADGDLKNVTISQLGHVNKIIVDEDHVSMDGGNGNVEERVKLLKTEIENEKDIAFKEQAKRRLGALQSGFAIIRVGAPTEPERDYIKLKIEDAVKSAKAALEEGVIRGGGLPLTEIAETLGKESIVYGALCAPYERIKANAGGEITIPQTVLDPVKVTRLAVENAFSVASQLITADVSIAERRRTLVDDLQQSIAPDPREDFRLEENQDGKYMT